MIRSSRLCRASQQHTLKRALQLVCVHTGTAFVRSEPRGQFGFTHTHTQGYCVLKQTPERSEVKSVCSIWVRQSRGQVVLFKETCMRTSKCRVGVCVCLIAAKSRRASAHLFALLLLKISCQAQTDTTGEHLVRPGSRMKCHTVRRH